MIVDLDRSVRRLDRNAEWSDPAPLSTYRYAPAYVLLGDPGAGKSTAFERERRETPDAELVTARDFRTIYGTRLSPGVQAVFIDGLDEARAGAGDPRGPFDEIRARLRGLAPRRVRISCRELDWLGENDRMNLAKVVPGGELLVLRLDPLDGDEQHRIVEARKELPDAEAFVGEATERGVGGLLSNPQTLVLLARVVAEKEDFPKGRKETFEEACRLLASETNEEHRGAAPLPPSETLLEAAGHMCVVGLLSGLAGFSLPDAPPVDGFLSISVFGQETDDAVRAAGTRLFPSVGGRRFVPAHANLAAFLAARYVAGLMNGSVPHGRILALLTGCDGAPPTHLRGLVAWLATISPALRGEFIARDPVAVLFYGDIHDFSGPEKSMLLRALGSDPSRLHSSAWSRPVMERFPSADMEPAVRQLLRDRTYDRRTDATLKFLTTALRRAPHEFDVAAELRQIVTDNARSFHVRDTALRSWIHALREHPNRITQERAVLDSIVGRSVSDDGHDLRGILLDALYPGALPPAEVWSYLDADCDKWTGRHALFWWKLGAECPPEDLAAHLDHLATSIAFLRPRLEMCHLSSLPTQLLARGLAKYADRLETARLAGWLRVGWNQWGNLTHSHQGPFSKANATVRKWLERHPEIQKSLIRYWVQSTEEPNTPSVRFRLESLLYESHLPNDIGAWHLREACVTENSKVRKFHLESFIRDLAERPTAVDESLAAAFRGLRDRPKALKFVRSRLVSELPKNHLRDPATEQAGSRPRVAGDPDLIEAVSNSRDAVRENRVALPLLYQLAYYYFTGGMGLAIAGEPDRVRTALGGDEELTALAMTALRKAPERSDLPSAEEVVGFARDNQRSLLATPVLAGLAEREPDGVLELPERNQRSAAALRMTFHAGSHGHEWYRALARNRPRLVADVLVLVCGAFFRMSKTPIPEVEITAFNADFGAVAALATLPLLSKFPLRATQSRLRDLDLLLWSGLRHVESGSFREVIESRVARPSMTGAQRTRWLAAGLCSAPGDFLTRVQDDIGDSEKKIQHLIRFLTPDDSAPALLNRLHVPALAFLIRTIAPRSEPVEHRSLEPRVRRPEPPLIEDLIRMLQASPERAASRALGALAADPNLSKWREELERAGEIQRVVRRDASYQVPSPTQVIAALRDGPPGSADDLRALSVDRLDRISEELRTTNANLWRQFWTEDKQRNRPKDENACRDALLPPLRHRLPEGCDAQPEGQYAANRRADIRIASGKWNVPVEIKKNSHRDVWSAIRNQLLPRYTNDPATEGLGIYLVLWFGPQHTAPVPEGPRPQTPDALRDRLLAKPT
ncbi:MAG: hypothetical protein OXC14_18125, partial [Rhodospirillaceae bacterium]|nr:hypothetical protein [Rhodospirillaceae bacterium]